jgi:hypothetical protein
MSEIARFQAQKNPHKAGFWAVSDAEASDGRERENSGHGDGNESQQEHEHTANQRQHDRDQGQNFLNGIGFVSGIDGLVG